MPDVLTPLGNLPANTPGLPAPAPAAPAASPVLDPTGTVPVAGSILDPAHPANPLNQAPAPAAPAIAGLLEPGNIDLNNRPIHQNPDGSISTVRSASFNIDGKEVLLPTIAPDGTPLTDDQAIALYMRTGQHLGKFDNPDNATTYAKKLHEDQARLYLPKIEGPQPPPGSITEVDGSTTMPGPPPTVEEAARRQYESAAGVAKVKEEQALNAADQAKVQQQNDAAKADLLKKQAAEQVAEEQRQRAGLDAAAKERDRLRNEVKDFKFHNFWDTRSTGQELLAGLGMILGGASFNANHVNQAVQVVDNAISREWAQQEATLKQKIEAARDAGEDVKELQSRYQYESGRLKLRQEAQLNAFAAEADRLSSFSRNQAGVLEAKKLAAEARALAEQQGQAGIKAIADAHTQKLKDALTVAETSKAYAEARAAADRARRDRGELTPKEQEAEAKTAYAQYQKGLEEITDKKTGLIVKQHELDQAVSKVEKDPKNPLNWVALFDNMIRTNTGKAAIMSQYRLYTGHAAGSVDEANQFLSKLFSGNPSKKQKENALQAAKDSQSELYDQGGKANQEFWDTVNSDVRFQTNPKAKNALRVLERMTFSKLKGYGQQPPASPAAAAPTPQQAQKLNSGFKVIQ